MLTVDGCGGFLLHSASFPVIGSILHFLVDLSRGGAVLKRRKISIFKEYALGQCLYVIEPSGETFNITPPNGQLCVPINYRD